ncbi:haloacid dehalogenase type II [Candidatus Mycobacterium wuenschmannii]|uniref:Haloacid dehalogenase type II n=1 Tax=Candidatus Mycobacterium wuenschmannii TaxID=3027808 RepID=A0ABY8VSU6_9MYCO|nr:haloacid dehalogenase type II [Candidatus Mycobacterium wuenschmannii]WIM86156.1 haloacid dehalogenase type II [Candidatus Mycobacterium wuenschmannii]
MTPAPSVLVFDVNETLIDIESMAPFFERLFGDSSAMRIWFGQLVMYSMSATLSGRYVDFFTLGQAVLRMLATTAGVHVTDDDALTLKHLLLTMPAHPDAKDSLEVLRDSGLRLVTLSNSPPNLDGPTPLEHAGLSHLFERQFSIDEVRSFKPAPAGYRYVSEQLGVDPAECMMVAAHVWDTIGAQSAGFGGALITRPGNAELPVAGLPRPTIVVTDLRALAAQLGR